MKTPTSACRACGNVLSPAVRIPVRQVPHDLFRCDACGLYEFPTPDWLDAAYEDPIAAIDVGLVARCLFSARVTEAIARAEKLDGHRHLDYGGGNGLLTRQLRDRGIDMYHQDPLAANLFAQTFEGKLEDDYGVVTMMEVFEHITDPLDVMEKLAKHAQVVIVSTVLVPEDLENIADWWYLIPDLGQHITFYTPAALAAIADHVGMHVVSNGLNLHVFSRRPLSRLSRLVVKDVRTARFVARALRLRQHSKSLTEADAASVMQAFSHQPDQPPTD